MSTRWLRDLPISSLKIDKSFVLAMHADADDALIVRSMVDLAHNLNMQVVAESVETALAVQTLSDDGCDSAQGYHLCRPIQADALLAWWQQHPTFVAPVQVGPAPGKPAAQAGSTFVAVPAASTVGPAGALAPGTG